MTKPSTHFCDEEIFGPEEPPLISLETLPSWIIYEDADLLVLNKPGWVVCHPSKNGPLSSLVGAARLYTGLPSLHLVARLDRETSGIVLLGKTIHLARKMQISFEQRMVEKTYLAILHGELSHPLEVSRPIGPDPNSAVAVKQKVVRDGSGRKAQTTFLPLYRKNGYTLCQVKPHTGRKHQIRVHAQWMGFPVVGDKLYGADETFYLEFAEKGFTARLQAALPLPRQALHAWRIDFLSETLPGFCAPLWPDLHNFLQQKMDLDEDAWARLPIHSLPAPHFPRQRGG